jgi:hypothetical protein
MKNCRHIRRAVGLLALILWNHVSGFSQVDSSYIELHKNEFILKPYLYSNLLGLNLKETEQDKEVTYRSNNPTGIGIGLAHPKLPFGISIGWITGARSENKYVRTKSFDVLFNQYGRKYVLDIFYQQYKGLFSDSRNVLPIKIDCPDLSVFGTGIVGQYVFNGNKFSYQAAFDQNERQIKSAGSLLVGGALHFIRLTADSSFKFDGQKKKSAYQAGVNVGYSYSWVPQKRWLFNGSITLGANLVNNSIKSFFNRNLYVAPTALARATICYNHEKWHAGMAFVTNYIELRDKTNAMVNLNYGRIYFFYVRKFSIQR